MKYQDLGSSFEVVYINRPSFDLFGRKVEFDFSPKKIFFIENKDVK